MHNFGINNTAMGLPGTYGGAGMDPTQFLLQALLTMAFGMTNGAGGFDPGGSFSPFQNPGFGAGGGGGCGCGSAPLAGFLGQNPSSFDWGNYGGNYGGGNYGGPGGNYGGGNYGGPGGNYGGGNYGGPGGNYGGGNYGGPGGNYGAPNVPSVAPPGGAVSGVDMEGIIAGLPQSRQSYAREHFPGIIAEAQRQGITNKDQLSYILATATHESGAGKWMEEIASGRAYEGRRDLGNTQRGDGVRYKGRGYVQITGRRNYEDWSRRLGVDLVRNPELASRPDIAAKILVGGMKDGTFTGKRLDDYINGRGTDFRNARRIVNGTDRASSIGGIAQNISRGVRSTGSSSGTALASNNSTSRSTSRSTSSSKKA